MRSSSVVKLVLILLVVGVSIWYFSSILNTGSRRSKAAATKPLIPKPAIVMADFDIERSYGASYMGEEIYDETRATMNVAYGSMESKVQSGMSRDQANALVNQFKSENGGKIYLETVQSQLNGSTDVATMYNYWKPILDNPAYDGIFINEYTYSFSDGTPASQNAIALLQKVRQDYPNKIIMPAIVQAMGFSGQPNPYVNNQNLSFKNFLQAIRDNTDLIFYEFFIYTGQDEFAFFDTSKAVFNSTAPGVLSKIFYGLYIPQSIDTEKWLDDKAVDANPNVSVGYHFQRQFEKLNRDFTETAGVGFWTYYRARPHIMKTVNALVKNCYLTKAQSCGNLPQANLLQNPSFEQGSGSTLSGWTSSGTVQQIDYSSTQICDVNLAYSSVKWCTYLKLPTKGLSLQGAGSKVSQTVSLEGNTQYYMKVYIWPKYQAGQMKPIFRVKYNSSETTAVLPVVEYDPSTGPNKWKIREYWFKTPSDASSAVVSIENGSGGEMYVDGIKLEKTLYTGNLSSITPAPTTPIVTTTGTPTTIPTGLPPSADFNNDRKIDMIDFMIWSSNYKMK